MQTAKTVAKISARDFIARWGPGGPAFAMSKREVLRRLMPTMALTPELPRIVRNAVSDEIARAGGSEEDALTRLVTAGVHGGPERVVLLRVEGGTTVARMLECPVAVGDAPSPASSALICDTAGTVSAPSLTANLKPEGAES